MNNRQIALLLENFYSKIHKLILKYNLRNTNWIGVIRSPKYNWLKHGKVQQRNSNGVTFCSFPVHADVKMYKTSKKPVYNTKVLFKISFDHIVQNIPEISSDT